MTPPSATPSSLGRYVRAVFGMMLFAGGVTVGVIEGVALLHGQGITTAGAVLVGVMLLAGVLMTDQRALLELPDLLKAWKNGV